MSTLEEQSSSPLPPASSALNENEADGEADVVTSSVTSYPSLAPLSANTAEQITTHPSASTSPTTDALDVHPVPPPAPTATSSSNPPMLFWSDMSDTSSVLFPPPTPTDLARRRGRRPPPNACQRRFRTLLRCICFPVMVLTTLVALLMFFMFVGLPFLLFLTGLLAVYYCCTSDPIPFRTLLRAMVGVEDWNGGAFDGTGGTAGGEPYHVTKEDIKQGIIRRLCLGYMEWNNNSHANSNNNSNDNSSSNKGEDSRADAVVPDMTVGGDLAKLPRDHPGRVHWRNEGSSVTCLVFSAPLGSTGSSPSDSTSGMTTADTATNIPLPEDMGPGSITAQEILQRDEESGKPRRIPRYLQQHEEEEKVQEGEDLESSQTQRAVQWTEEMVIVNKETTTIKQDGSSPDPPVLPVESVADVEHSSQPTPTAVSSPENAKSDDNDDSSSVRDRGTVCDICLLEFETGEAVAWSPNPACNHAYHEECITDWLLRKPTCPSCRQNFILLPTTTSRQEDTSGILLEDDENESSRSSSRSSSGDMNSESSSSSSTDDGNHWNGLQPPVTAATTTQDGDVEMGTSSNTMMMATTRSSY